MTDFDFMAPWMTETLFNKLSRFEQLYVALEDIKVIKDLDANGALADFEIKEEDINPFYGIDLREQQ